MPAPDWTAGGSTNCSFVPCLAAGNQNSRPGELQFRSWAVQATVCAPPEATTISGEQHPFSAIAAVAERYYPCRMRSSAPLRSQMRISIFVGLMMRTNSTLV